MLNERYSVKDIVSSGVYFINSDSSDCIKKMYKINCTYVLGGINVWMYCCICESGTYLGYFFMIKLLTEALMHLSGPSDL